MSWTFGSNLLSHVRDSVMTLDNTEHEDLVHVFKYIIEDFRNFDCGTIDECVGVSEAFDEAYNELLDEENELNYTNSMD